MDQEEEKEEGASDLLVKVRGSDCLHQQLLEVSAPVIDKINSFIGHLISKQVSGAP